MADLKQVEENVYDSLRQLGLSELEINLYTISLLLGPSSISELAKHLNMPRPNVYKVIAGLEKHGLAKFSEHKKYSRSFTVESPTLVLEKLRQKQEAMSDLGQHLTSAMPDLLALYRQGATPTKIRVLEGKEQFLKIYQQILDEAKDQIEFFGSASDILAFISWEHQREWAKRRVAKKINVRSLVLPGKGVDLIKGVAKEELRELRIFKSASPFTTSFNIFANKVVLWQPKAPLVVLIEDQYIVQMFRSIFYTLYDKAER
ncbi:MAG: Transcriptional regulator, TrmB [Parcubacteria group bacterium Gr01-1014_19]|nr:MAG: Transcriptional regulator, TrmB [Parcubacteria group bacterium Gr01-1014_19]